MSEASLARSGRLNEARLLSLQEVSEPEPGRAASEKP